jgi:spheroidene monooxygenase
VSAAADTLVARGAAVRSAGAVAVLLVADIAPEHRAWGWSRFVLRRRPLRGIGGLRFSKLLGSGHQGGFGLRPSGSMQALFCGFNDDTEADAFLGSDLVAAYRRRARHWFSVRLRAFSSRGSWDGHALAVTAGAPDGPVATLTRASIRPAAAFAFWRHAPPSQQALAGAAGCRLAVGLGEMPLLRQATFSVWDSVAAMDRYARTGAHLQAIRASHAGRYFSESMFVRFAPSAFEAQWPELPHG